MYAVKREVCTMKKYRIRKGSPLHVALMILLALTIILLPALGNHYIDGIGMY